jgi:hypothetical protein
VLDHPHQVSRQFLKIQEASQKYGPTVSAFRRWILEGSLGTAAVKRFGRLVFLDGAVLDERVSRTGKLLVSNDDSQTTAKEQQ